MTNPDFRDTDGQHDVSFITVVLYAHLQNNGYLESFTDADYWSITTFDEELRNLSSAS